MITRARAREQEKRRRLIIFLRIPSETWTDVFKMFPRRTLVQNISPVCYRLKQICNRNMKTIHVIMQAGRFGEKLRQNDPKANQQLQYLAENDCQLARQFRISSLRIFEQNKAILHHCTDLFRGCLLALFPYYADENATHFNECLTYLGPAKPFVISICLYNYPLIRQSLRHPTIWDCNRIRLILPSHSTDAMQFVMPFLDWLHQQPIDVEDGSKDGVAEPIVRYLIIQYNYYETIQEAIDWLINGSIQNFQQSQGPKDRRQFVISFSDWNHNQGIFLDQFERRHNQATGEVILLEREDEADYNGTVYRLRRCLAEEADNGNEFYEKTFQRCPSDEFVENDGPLVQIE